MTEPLDGNKVIGTNPCVFMKLPKCMRQDQSKQLNLDICHACIAGRAEGHLFEIKKKLTGDNTQRN
jgi:hypothetical protein